MIQQHTIESPLTGGKAVYQKEMRETEFRGEKFVYEHHNIRDLETDMEFTTTEIDEGNVQRVYAQYRAAHDIPSPEELTKMREEYGLSAAKMSEILNTGSTRKDRCPAKPSVRCCVVSRLRQCSSVMLRDVKTRCRRMSTTNSVRRFREPSLKRLRADRICLGSVSSSLLEASPER